jgi:hypothetical protein
MIEWSIKTDENRAKSDFDGKRDDEKERKTRLKIKRKIIKSARKKRNHFIK